MYSTAFTVFQEIKVRKKDAEIETFESVMLDGQLVYIICAAVNGILRVADAAGMEG